MTKLKTSLVFFIFLIILLVFVYSISANNLGSTSLGPEDYSLKAFLKWLLGIETKSQSYWKSTYVLTENQFADGYDAKIGSKERIEFKINEGFYYLGIIKIKDSSVKIILGSDNQTLKLGDSRKMDLNSDGYFDVFFTLNSIKVFFKKADITLFYIHEKTNQESLFLEKEKELNALDKFENSRDSFDFKEVDWWVWLILLLIFLMFMVVLIIYFSIKK